MVISDNSSLERSGLLLSDSLFAKELCVVGCGNRQLIMYYAILLTTDTL